MEDVVKTATGVFIGALLALLAHDWVLASIAKYELGEALRAVQVQTEKSQREAARRAAESNQRQREIEAEAREREEQVRSAAEAARLNAIGKEQTFLRRYQPSPKCALDPSTIECANEHMRARKEFDTNWGK